jgi:glucose/arabinose dehydrogenase/PKD repeat protein
MIIRRAASAGLFAVALLCSVFAARPTQAQVTFTDPGFVAETVVTLPPYKPVGVAFAADGRLFVWQRDGVVRVVKNGNVLPTPFADMQSVVNQYEDRGLLGLALDENFGVTGQVYLLYTYAGGGSPNDSGPKTARLTRITADPANPDVALPGSEVVVLDGIPADATSHSIGAVRFAPDGTVFLGTGDAASYSGADSLALRAQSLDSYAGKILCIQPDGTAVASNPFYDGTNSIRSKVWAYGLRNPFRFALHPTSGEPYIGDVGWNGWEEVNRGTAGANLGWPCYEGSSPQPTYRAAFVQCQQLASTAVTAPLYAYSTGAGAAVIGGTFYEGTPYPALYRGNLFVADYVRGWINRLVLDATGNLVSVQPFAANLNGPVAVERGPDGLLYYVEFNSGRVGRIRFNGPVVRMTATPASGYSPLTVAFSSAGSQSPNGPLSYAWQFGDGGTSTQPDPIHTYGATGVQTFTARLTVTDPAGLSASATITVTVGSLPPTATILAPADGTPYAPGQVVVFQGAASDPDEGLLGPAALEWTVLLHHNDSHVHPVATLAGSGGSFVVTDHGAGSFAYEVILTATDGSGLVDRRSILLPVTKPIPTLLSFVPNPVVGGGSSTGTVVLSEPAPADGAAVALSSNHVAVQVPASVTVPGGSTSAAFTATTSAVASPVTATITASTVASVQAVLTVTAAGSAIPVLTGLSPTSGAQGQTLNVVIVGSGFASGATCSFGAGITVTGCVVAGGTQLTASLAIGATAAPGARTVTVTNPDGQSGSLGSGFTVTAAGAGGVTRWEFTYGDRGALLGAGWDYVARTASGGSRNTEQGGGLGVSYDQAAHPGRIRIPLGAGEIWREANNSENTLFRDLPGDWTSIRVKVAAFAPVANYQQVGLLAYQDDDNYVNLNRGYVGGQTVELFGETGGRCRGRRGRRRWRTRGI